MFTNPGEIPIGFTYEDGISTIEQTESGNSRECPKCKRKKTRSCTSL